MAGRFPAEVESFRACQLPLGGAVAQRLRGYGWRSEKSVKAIAPTGAALAFLCFDFFFRIVKGVQPLTTGCGTQHPLRALGGTRVLLAAAPTTPPCFRHWRRSSSLHSDHIQRKNYFIISEYRSVCGRSGIPFSREEFRTNSLSQSLTALPAPSRREPLARPGTLHFSQKLYRHAKGPISEDDFPRPGEDVAAGDKKGNLSP